MNKCMKCKQLKPLHKDSYFKYTDSTLTEKVGFVCGDCGRKEQRKINRAYKMIPQLLEII
jgi:hypothetical protein